MHGRGADLLERPEGADAAVVDEDQLARLDVAQEARADDVERDRLGGEDGRFAELAHDQRTDAERVAAGDQPFLGQHDQRIGAFDLLQRVGQPVERGRAVGRRDEVDDHFGVAGRLEDRAAAVERSPQLHRVREIAVVGDREAALGKLGEQRLDVAERRLARRRIADVADCGAAGEPADDIVAVEIAGDMAHRPVRVEMLAVEGGDARRFLAAMLQRVQAERDEARRIVGAPDAEHAALLAQLVVIERIGRQHVRVPEPPARVTRASYRAAARLCRPRLNKA